MILLNIGGWHAGRVTCPSREQAIVEHGLDVTADQIAAVAGVGRATLFRHFTSRDDLLAAAVVAGGHQLSADLPDCADGDWQRWLADICAMVHTLSALSAHWVWELTGRRQLSAPLSRAAEDLACNRGARFRQVTDQLWTAVGGSLPAPEPLFDAVAAHLSPLFTVAVLCDAGGGSADHHTAARLAEQAIVAALNATL